MYYYESCALGHAYSLNAYMVAVWQYATSSLGRTLTSTSESPEVASSITVNAARTSTQSLKRMIREQTAA